MVTPLDTTVSTKCGFRLQRLEVSNWGTFDSAGGKARGRIHAVEPDGETTLLIGKNGSGKSTLVDALLALLVRPQVRNFNVAAGAKKQERDLKTYVQGAFDRRGGAEENGAAVQFLRPGGKHCSILLACFHNERSRRAFTVAQILYVTADGKAEKIYCFAPEEKSIAADLSGLHSTEKLIQQIRERGFRATKKYTEYFEWFRKATGVQPKAMDMFNQTVAVKDIERLNPFIRGHMLEARPWNEKVETLLSHFNQLNEAWRALVRVRRQHELLAPIADIGAKYQAAQERLERTVRVLDAADTFFCRKRIDLFEPECEQQRARLSELIDKKQQMASDLADVREECRKLTNEIEAAGGERLREIPGLIRVERTRAEQKRGAHRRLHKALRDVGVDASVDDEKSFQKVRAQLPALRDEFAEKTAATQSERDDRHIERARAGAALEDDERELAALAHRQGNLPAWLVELRARMCDALHVPASELPFAAELISVKDEERSWEASIELELRPLAFSLLVPKRYYRRVSEYVEKTPLRDAHNRGRRLVYLKIDERDDVENAPVPHPRSLVRKLELREGHPLTPWLRAELEARYDYRCCETIEEFQEFRGPAMTRERHVKSGSVRHSKDDRQASLDGRNFVLGWENREKRRRLAEAIARQRENRAALDALIAELDEELARLRRQQAALERALEVSDFASIDFTVHEAAIEQLERERRQLEDDNDAIAPLKQRLAAARQQSEALEHQIEENLKRQGDLERRIQSGEQILANAAQALETRRREGTLAEHAEIFPLVESFLEASHLTVDDLDSEADGFKETRRREVAALTGEVEPVRSALEKAMMQFLREFPEEAGDLRPHAAYLDGFLGKLARIEDEGLPEHTERFRSRLNDKVTREIQLLNSEFDQERDAITDRIDLLNESLARIPWREGTHMRLEARLVRDREITQFRKALAECVAHSFEGSSEADEARFLEIEKLIGRLREEGRWRDKVTDVRNWFDFAAREVDDATGEGRSYFEDSAGQSGGEKAKLAFTILVAAIAYQYDVDPARETSDRFHFVVVDEMFSKVDDQYAEYALDLFRQFGLQLLIVAPLDAKARVTEPFVGTYLLVTKDETNRSQIHQMTAREFREQTGQEASREGYRPGKPR